MKKYIFVISFSIIVLNPITGITQATPRWSDYNRQGLEYYTKGDNTTNSDEALSFYKLAADSFTKAIDTAPPSLTKHNLAVIYFNRCYAYGEISDHLNNKLEIEEFAAKYADDICSVALLDCSLLTDYFNDPNFCEKVESPETYNKRSAEGWCELGKKYDDNGNHSKAIECYRKACEKASLCCGQ
jgi:tetratricopeptide (TPR) repeat protein